jgi:ribonuclease P protein component
LDKQERYFLGKEDRLKSRKSIDLLFKKGKSFSHFPFKVFWMQATSDHVLQAAFSVSSRNFKKATDRNRIKRLMRESYRLQKNTLSEALKTGQKKITLFIIYTGRELPEYNMVFEKTGLIIKKLIKLSNENTEADL